MSERTFNVLRAPHVSEKAARLQEVSNQYVFEVDAHATKTEVKAAVEKMFNVNVERVTVVNSKGKVKAFKGRAGSRNGARKAYVRLREGQTLDFGAKA
jgi:large subunit ribosomal protein L23